MIASTGRGKSIDNQNQRQDRISHQSMKVSELSPGSLSINLSSGTPSSFSYYRPAFILFSFWLSPCASQMACHPDHAMQTLGSGAYVPIHHCYKGS